MLSRVSCYLRLLLAWKMMRIDLLDNKNTNSCSKFLRRLSGSMGCNIVEGNWTIHVNLLYILLSGKINRAFYQGDLDTEETSQWHRRKSKSS